ncbi:hypothetical protein ABK040_008039 [Willaertia magna]
MPPSKKSAPNKQTAEIVRTPTEIFLESARRGDIVGVKNALEKRTVSNANVVDERPIYNGMTALIWATDCGHIRVVNFLVENGADINQQDNITKRTALHYAAMRNYRDILLLLLSKGADRNIRSNLGNTPEELATERGQTEAIETFKLSNEQVDKLVKELKL